ncbi:alpha-amylase [Clostridium polyendosporum]|uniref:Alpha-amylase n=1 Tax=Clostridium polyendosporum TaxID=69208 RepID=A0A919RZE7_9CLOT|nr:alpha-amylase family glycosyl hydrolase [Clostridium polyendosporum]GIM28526.1 alpha-amylase [Clostridium polyendosporum]
MEVLNKIKTDKIFEKRLLENIGELQQDYYELYGQREDVKENFEDLIIRMAEAYNNRKKALKELDEEREQHPDWFLSQEMVGMMLYVDLFADNLKGVKEKINYLKDLGVNYVHLMPLLKMPKGKNDGGYAVSSYTNIDEKFGTMEELEALADEFRKNKMSVCLDFVLNHTSKEHTWAERAKQGEKKYQDMYFMYDTDEVPRQFEATVPEVFPKVSPGNFTYYDEFKKWVFTSFYEFQWDLNYHNPFVTNKIAEKLLFLANKGVEVLRLDAIPFMWKELWTNCRNLPQVHTVMRILRVAAKIVCPGVMFKGEAIVTPREILKYFGEGKDEGKECQTMYNASMMVLLWNSLATRDTRLMQMTLERSPKIPHTATWMNYARCHDDIGWGFENDIIKELGMDPFQHKQFIINFYKGNYPGSFAKGELYEFDEVTMDARTSGTLASLCGLEKALEEHDKYGQELAIKRILLLHSVILSYGGIPVIYSGDEIGQLNDYSYKQNAEKYADSRWLHRPKMNWEKVKNTDNLATIEGTIYKNINKMIECRKENTIFRSDNLSEPFYTGNKGVLGYFKTTGNEKLLVLANFSEYEQHVDMDILKKYYSGECVTDMLQQKKIDLNSEKIILAPYEFLWLA